jgi:hypothetical protein
VSEKKIAFKMFLDETHSGARSINLRARLPHPIYIVTGRRPYPTTKGTDRKYLVRKCEA